MTPQALATLFFLQMVVIIGTCRVVGWAVQRWLGQPQVVGEMIAGVLLGPSLFGALAPAVQGALFPPAMKPVLYIGAQLGVGLYMFLVGLSFDRREFAQQARAAAVVSSAGMLAPFAAAALLVHALLPVDALFTPGVSRAQASLFLGAAIAITAFPMLARILHERGMAGTRLGTLALSAGAIGDAGAWVVIALVLATMGGGPDVLVRALAIGGGSAALMLWLGPRVLAPLARRVRADGTIDEATLALVLVAFLLAAFVMDYAGIHAVFGGFLLGAVMPRGALVDAVRARLEPFAVVFMLPMFFTYSGLHTDLTVLGGLGLAGATVIILIASFVAKGGATYLAARATGSDHGTAAAIGALMNARGLMELIVIGIGLERGIITPALFAILVLMAILTTLAATPLFEWVYARPRRRAGVQVAGAGVADAAADAARSDGGGA